MDVRPLSEPPNTFAKVLDPSRAFDEVHADNISVQKRQRKLSPQGRLDAAETRERGACKNCRLKKVKVWLISLLFIVHRSNADSFFSVYIHRRLILAAKLLHWLCRLSTNHYPRCRNIQLTIRPSVALPNVWNTLKQARRIHLDTTTIHGAGASHSC